jgi:hypothetical protein
MKTGEELLYYNISAEFRYVSTDLSTFLKCTTVILKKLKDTTIDSFGFVAGTIPATAGDADEAIAAASL